MMARDAAHENFVHTLETMAAFIKANPEAPIPLGQTVVRAWVNSDDEVTAFALAHGLGAPVETQRHLYIDVRFGAIVYRVTSERA